MLGPNGGLASSFVEYRSNCFRKAGVAGETGVLAIDRPSRQTTFTLQAGVATPFTMRLNNRSFLRDYFGMAASSARVDYFSIADLEYVTAGGTPLSATFNSS